MQSTLRAVLLPLVCFFCWALLPTVVFAQSFYFPDTLSIPSPTDSVPQNTPLQTHVVPKKPAKIAQAPAPLSASSYLPTQVTIDPSYAVGEIPLSYQVSPTGAVMYSVPIECVAARNGAQPNLGIVYNSMGGNGILGAGWSISGLSAISRLSSSLYYNGLTAPVTLAANGPYQLDGNRLFTISNAYMYETEDRKTAVKALGIGDVRSFEVNTPDGSLLKYGFASNTTNQLVYPISSLVDKFGNSIQYSYTPANGQYYLDVIGYGSTLPDGSKQLSVRLFYKTRNDVSIQYLAGKEIKEDRCLDRIECYSSNSLIRTYTFSYLTKNDQLLLNKITLTTPTSALSPLLFYYGTGSTSPQLETTKGYLTSTYTDSPTKDLIMDRGKFDPWSDEDALLVYPAKDGYHYFNQTGSLFSHSKSYYRSKYTPEQQLLVNFGLGSDMSWTTSIAAGAEFIRLLTMDENNDGGDEVVKINNNVIDGTYEELAFTCYKSVINLGAAFMSQYKQVAYKLSTVSTDQSGNKSVRPKEFLVGDFNGDGKQEVFAITRQDACEQNWTSICYLFDLQSQTKIYESATSGLTYTETYDLNTSNRIFGLDFDGDGKTDICVMKSTGTEVFSFVGNTFVKIATNAQLTLASLRSRNLLVGDVNGDGKTDLLVSAPEGYYDYRDTTVPVNTPEVCYECWEENPGLAGEHCRNCGDLLPASDYCAACGRTLIFNPGSGQYYNAYYCPEHGTTREKQERYFTGYTNTWKLYLSNGANAFVVTDLDFIYNENYNSSTPSTHLLQDVNGDGKCDLIRKSGSSVTTYLSKETSFSLVSESYASVDQDAKLIPVTVALNRNKAQLLAVSGNKFDFNTLRYTQNSAKEALLTGVVSSLGVINHTAYEALNGNGRYFYTYDELYEKKKDAVFPYANFDGALNVLAKNESFHNNTLLASTRYQYKNAVIHRQGLGFCGFEGVTVVDELTNKQTTTTSNPYQFGVVTQQVSETTEVNNKYNISVGYTKQTTIRLIEKEQKDLLNGNRSLSTFTYDLYGNPITETVDYGGGLKTVNTNSFSNFTASTNYLIGRLDKQSITSWDNSALSTRSIEYAYDAKNCVIAESKFFNGAKTGTTRSSYDAFGNLSRDSTQLYQSPTHFATNWVYDPLGNQVIEERNSLGLPTYYANYNLMGFPQKVSDRKQNVTTHVYDSFGRLIKTTRPTGEVEETLFSWHKEGNIVSKVIQKASNAPTQTTYYDALNRAVKTATVRSDGSELLQTTVYNQRGQVEKASLPYKGATPSLWNQYEYDTYGRLTALNYASGKVDTYQYGKNSTTSIIDGMSSSKNVNSKGQLISVTDLGGTIAYTYRADGQLSAILAPGNITTSFTYDEFGRKTAINDPNAGIRSYQYDLQGAVNKETDAEGRVTNLVYDKWGRMIEKEVVGTIKEKYTYSVDGLLTAARSNLGTYKEITYDKYGRVIEDWEYGLQSTSFYKKYSYNQSGQLFGTWYGTRFEDFGYEEYGYRNGNFTTTTLYGYVLGKIYTIWGASEENSLGLTTKAYTGPYTREYDYDVFGLPTRRGTFLYPKCLQHFGYAFDAKTGNLKTRWDYNNIKTEQFGYDGLNRLSTTGVTTDATYDPKGNIVSKANVGSFSYATPNKPYAISTVTPTAQAPVMRNQTITYNGLQRPETISENGCTAKFTYNGSGDRVKMEYVERGYDLLTRYYLGNQYEFDESYGSYKERLYLGGDSYSAPAVMIKKDEGDWELFFILRDYLGSVTMVLDSKGDRVEENSYDAWGRLRDPATHVVYGSDNQPNLMLGRGYTGHEHLPSFGLINMNARLYDPVVGRFLSPDPFVQMPDYSQNFNRYSYGLNNPLKFTDPNGELFFVPILVGMVIGAAIGASTAAVAYSATALITGSTWSLQDFSKSVGMGALGGAIGGGIGAVGGLGAFGSFGNSFGYNMLEQITGTTVTNITFGNSITWSSAAGMVVGGAIGAGLPNFKALSGGAFKNTVAEIGFNTAKGTIKGLGAGLTMAAIDGDPQAIGQNMLGGAIGGATNTVAMNLAFGSAYKPTKSYPDKNGNTPLYRRGGILLPKGTGMTLGRNAAIQETGDSQRDAFLEAHESYHVHQQTEMGWSQFYTRTIIEYLRAYLTTGDWRNVYKTPNTLEYDADQFGYELIYK